MKIQAIPNRYNPNYSFICLDVPAEPYLDGMGRPLRDAHGEIMMQMPKGIGIGHDLPNALALDVVTAWNAHEERTATLDGVKKWEPKRAIWCKPCKAWSDAESLTALVCPKCGSDVILKQMQSYGERSDLPLTVDQVGAPDGRVGRFIVQDGAKDRFSLIQKLLSAGMVYEAKYDGASHGTAYIAWHPSFVEAKGDVPRYHLAWQGNRLVFGPGTFIRLKPGTYAPDWQSLQRRYPTDAFEIEWPDGSTER